MSPTQSNAFDLTLAALEERMYQSIVATYAAKVGAAQIASDCASLLERGESLTAVNGVVTNARTRAGKDAFNVWLTAFRSAMKRRGFYYDTVAQSLSRIVAVAPVAPPVAPPVGNGAPHGDKAPAESADMRALRDRNVSLSNRIRQLEAELDKVEAERDAAVKLAAFESARATKAESFAPRAMLAESLIVAMAALEDAARAPHAPRKSRAPRGKRPALTAAA